MLATTLLIRVVQNIVFWRGNYRDKDMPRYDLSIAIFDTIRYIVPSLLDITWYVQHEASGVTKVGVTRCVNWWCRPFLLQNQKWWPFSVVILKSHKVVTSFVICPTDYCHHSHPLRLSSRLFIVLLNSSADNILTFIGVSPYLDGVTWAPVGHFCTDTLVCL